jgi:hypothetical protein
MSIRTIRCQWRKLTIWGMVAVLGAPAAASAFFPPFNHFPYPPPVQTPPVVTPPPVQPPPVIPTVPPPIVTPGGGPDIPPPVVVPPVQAQTPEPATIVGCLTGLAFLKACSMRRRRRQAD